MFLPTENFKTSETLKQIYAHRFLEICSSSSELLKPHQEVLKVICIILDSYLFGFANFQPKGNLGYR